MRQCSCKTEEQDPTAATPTPPAANPAAPSRTHRRGRTARLCHTHGAHGQQCTEGRCTAWATHCVWPCCTPLIASRVLSPRPNRPRTPSRAITCACAVEVRLGVGRVTCAAICVHACTYTCTYTGAYLPRGVGVRGGGGRGLPHRLEHAERIGHAVRRARRAEPEGGRAQQPQRDGRAGGGVRQRVVEEVEGPEPAPHTVHRISSAPSARCTVWQCTVCGPVRNHGYDPTKLASADAAAPW